MKPLSLVILLAVPVLAQTTTTPRRGHIRAYGEATVAVKPDMAQLNVSIVTEAATAQEASESNATRSTAVFEKLRSVVGSAGEIRTLYYNVTPKYNYRDSVAILTGFTATNTVEVTVNDLNLTGRLIDTAVQAGANRIDSLRLMLKDEEPVRAQALRLAGQKARVKAEAIALGVGARVGPLISAEEGVSVSPIPYGDARTGAAAATAATTPVVTGTLEVRATITVNYETVL